MAPFFPEQDTHDSVGSSSKNHRSRSPSPALGIDKEPETPPRENIFFPAKSPFGSRSSSPGPNMDNEPRDIDSVSVDSMESVLDHHGRKQMNLDSERTTTAYEAWELSVTEEKHSRRAWKSLFGIKFGTQWTMNDFKCIAVTPDVSFGQGELADMYEDAVRSYKHKRGTSQEMAYEQNLANRVYDLPGDSFERLQQLVANKIMVTNHNPHRKREWHIVLLQAGGFQVTKLSPVDHKWTSIFSRKRSRPATRPWFVILRGQEVRSTKEDGGWKTFDESSNPWWRFDKRETKKERDQYKKMGRPYPFESFPSPIGLSPF
ncbi:hypothetical protein F5Y03DRAFT_395559 [Xylaria venustula]|nr:hypothetical protein F5Y03DRAFT_395559 [Xylaria venustula]